MASIKIPASSFSLNSEWKCTKHNSESGPYFSFDEGYPTVSQRNVDFRYSIPSGAVIRSASVHASFSAPESGISIMNVNGSGFGSVSEGSAPASLVSTNATYTGVFTFKANGTMEDESFHSAAIVISDVYLEIIYDVVANAYSNPSPRGSEGLSIPPQGVAVCNQYSGSVYIFDGVVKIQHSGSLKMEEEPDEKKASQFVNNAKNEPDKVTLDIIMSDVYSGQGDLGGGGIDYNAYGAGKYLTDQTGRSAKAYGTLHDLKEERILLTIITPQFVYSDMLITSITLNQDEETPFGWQGQIVFSHKYDPVPVEEEKEENNSSNAKTGNATRSKSLSTQGYEKLTGQQVDGKTVNTVVKQQKKLR